MGIDFRDVIASFEWYVCRFVKALQDVRQVLSGDLNRSVAASRDDELRQYGVLRISSTWSSSSSVVWQGVHPPGKHCFRSAESAIFFAYCDSLLIISGSTYTQWLGCCLELFIYMYVEASRG